MGALSGSLAERAASRASRPAAMSSLHCNGDMDEMIEIAAEAPPLAGEAAARADARARAPDRNRAPFDIAAARACDFRPHDRSRRGRIGHVMTADIIPFDTEIAERATDEPALVVDVEGFEGPLDLLLTLARQQKVDLAKISILALADQYLAFIDAARKLRLELAADYLVMAAWLAYLKSRLLLPDLNAPEGQSAEDMATALAFRLKRLEAFREVAQKLLGSAATRSRHVQPRRSGADQGHQASAMDARRFTICCRPIPCSGRSRRLGQRPVCAAQSLVAGRSARSDRAADRRHRRLEPSRRISDHLSRRAVDGRARSRRRALRPRSKWYAKA